MLRTQIFYIHKAFKVIVIYKYENFMFPAFKIVPPYLKNLNNSQKFIIIDLISSFIQNIPLKEKSYQVLLAQIIQS